MFVQGVRQSSVSANASSMCLVLGEIRKDLPRKLSEILKVVEKSIDNPAVELEVGVD